MMGLEVIFAIMMMILAGLYYFLICAFTVGLHRKLRRYRKVIPTSGPFISIIVPVRNEANNISQVLAQFTVQDYPRELYEILVADDHSEDETMNILSGFAGEHPGFPLVIVPSDGNSDIRPGKKGAIERAIVHAKGEILLFTDADTERSPQWITAMVSPFENSCVKMVMGPVCFYHEKNLLQKIQSLEFMGLMGTTAGSSSLGFPVMCNGANLAYLKEAFVGTGGFSGNKKYHSGDDQFVMSAIREYYGEGSIIFNADPSAVVMTEAEPGIMGFVHQRMRWVSKSRGYRDPVVIVVGLATYLTHLSLLGGIIAGFFISSLLPVAALLWLIKILLEYPMVWIMMRFFGKKELAGYYFLAQVFQLIYVPLIGILGLVLPYRWKGRRS